MSHSAHDDSRDEESSTAFNDETAGSGREKAGKIETDGGYLHGKVTKSVIDAFYASYNKLDYGFLENVYCGALVLELRRRGHSVAREVLIPVFYDGVQVARYKADFIVDEVVLVEVKSTEFLNRNDTRQLQNYLRATKLEVGLLLHYGPDPKVYRLSAPNKH